MNSLYFQFDGKFYQQINGTSIGLSVSLILADLVIQDMEKIYLTRYTKSIKFYGRYVDNFFLIITKNKLNMLLNLVNNMHKRLKFTYEIEDNNRLSFLDIMVIGNKNTSISLDLFKKNIASGRYLNYLSSHTIQIKIGIVKTFANKVFTLAETLADKEFQNKNLLPIHNELILNNYLSHFINIILNI